MSTFNDIKKKYKKAIKNIHPDINGDRGDAEEINSAYEILKNYINKYKFTFSEDEIIKQYPEEFLKKFKV